jgi:alpha-beta hydrolase superfamily lysophospholipase
MITVAMKRLRKVTATMPVEIAKRDGLSYSLWIPDAPRAGIVILHGAGSCKESHHDYARAAHAAGFAAIAFDQRGHGASDGPMDGRALDDVALMAAVLRGGCRDDRLPLALRGSSMGGYLAILAAPLARADVVVAICPASTEGLRRGIEAGALQFDADVPALTAWLEAHDLPAAVGRLEIPLLLLHAGGDEQVPVEHSRELASLVRHPRSRLIALPGGHHRSIQHDPELQAVSLRFIEQTLS